MSSTLTYTEVTYTEVTYTEVTYKEVIRACKEVTRFSGGPPRPAWIDLPADSSRPRNIR
jgi:hypothetical protein